jgi:transcriptional regulator with GAF, ATPase, and Fis domain
MNEAQGAERAAKPDAGFDRSLVRLQTAVTKGGNELLDQTISDLLRLIRKHLAMDVVFVAEFVDGRRVYRRVESAADKRVIHEGESDPRENTFCQRIMDGRMPCLVNDVPAMRKVQPLPRFTFPVGSYMGVPVRLRDGRIYGTLCCFSFEPNKLLDERDVKRLEMSAQLTARLLDETEGIGASPLALPL